MKKAIRAVKRNKGAAGIDKMPAEELDAYFAKHKDGIKTQIPTFTALLGFQRFCGLPIHTDSSYPAQ